MALTEKFTFDLDFDEERARLIKERQVQQAEVKRQKEEQARQEAKLRYTPEQIEELKNQAREEGKRAGIEEARQSHEKASLDILTQALNKLQTLGEGEAVREKLAQRIGIETAFALLKKISPSLTEGKELSDVTAIIAQAFSENPEEQRLVIRVHDSILDTIIKNIDTVASQNGFSGKPIVLADQSLQPHDCRIEWADGGLERMTGSLWDGLEKAINHVLVGLPEAPKKEARTEEKASEAEVLEANEPETEEQPEAVEAVTDEPNTGKQEEVHDE